MRLESPSEPGSVPKPVRRRRIRRPESSTDHSKSLQSQGAGPSTLSESPQSAPQIASQSEKKPIPFGPQPRPVQPQPAPVQPAPVQPPPKLREPTWLDFAIARNRASLDPTRSLAPQIPFVSEAPYGPKTKPWTRENMLAQMFPPPPPKPVKPVKRRRVQRPRLIISPLPVTSSAGKGEQFIRYDVEQFLIEQQSLAYYNHPTLLSTDAYEVLPSDEEDHRRVVITIPPYDISSDSESKKSSDSESEKSSDSESDDEDSESDDEDSKPKPEPRHKLPKSIPERNVPVLRNKRSDGRASKITRSSAPDLVIPQPRKNPPKNAGPKSHATSVSFVNQLFDQEVQATYDHHKDFNKCKPCNGTDDSDRKGSVHVRIKIPSGHDQASRKKEFIGNRKSIPRVLWEHICYRQYNGFEKIPHGAMIETTCGVVGCSRKEHLKVK